MSLFHYDFMRSAFEACTIVGIVAGAIGYFLVLRGETFAGHALSHVGFPGATGAVLIGVSPFVGLTFATILAGVGIALLGERANRDIAIGIVLTFSLGLGLLFLHFYTAYASLATNILFGNVLGIAPGTIGVLAGLGAICLAGLAVVARPLLFASLQPELAEARGVPVAALSAIFMVFVAISTAETIQVVGVLLTFALLIAPAATAIRLTTTVVTGIVMSVGLALGLSWAGLTLAYYTDWPTSFWITSLGAVAYLSAAAVVRRRA